MFELDYYTFADQQINHYTMKTSRPHVDIDSIFLLFLKS